MSILDELRKEARRKQKIEDDAKRKRAIQDAAFEAKILPKLQYIYAYLSEVVDYLNDLQSQIYVSDYGKEYHELARLLQGDYQIQSDEHGGTINPGDLRRFSLSFICSGSGEFRHEVLGLAKIEKKISILHARGLSFRCLRHIHTETPKPYPSATFVIERRVPVAFSFSGQLESLTINITAKNHEGFVAKIYVVFP